MSRKFVVGVIHVNVLFNHAIEIENLKNQIMAICDQAGAIGQVTWGMRDAEAQEAVDWLRKYEYDPEIIGLTPDGRDQEDLVAIH